MKILHTADWHLGKKLDRFSRIEEQTLAMEEIIELAEQENVDAVIVAGDLFDNFNPNVEAIELFYKSLRRLSNNGNRLVLAIAGNHDSPIFIDAPNPLARACGIILIGFPNAEVIPYSADGFKITKTDKGFVEIVFPQHPYPLRVLHTPYANENRLKQYFGEEKQKSLNELLAHNWKNLADLYCDTQGVNILTTHLYMNKKESDILEEPEGEKPIKIGNADMVYSDAIPEQIQYTALGHLHGFHNIGSEEKPILYSSSPLAYSFSEAGQKKYAIIITVEPGQKATYQKKQLLSGRSLERKSFSNVENAVKWLGDNPNTWVELTLESETFLTAGERKKIFQTHQGIVYLIPKIKTEKTDINPYTKEIDLQKETSELFKEYFKSKYQQQEPNEELMNILKEIL